MVPSEMRKLLFLIFAVFVLFGLATAAAYAQTPPVSTVSPMPETTFENQISIHFTVVSSIPWDTGGGVGLYYRAGAMVDWGYLGNTYASPYVWDPPFSGMTYEFSSTVEDNNGNNEGYEFLREAHTFFDPGAGVPSETMIQWHWTHPTTGSQVVEYVAEWEVDGSMTPITGIAVGDTTFAFVEVPYQENSVTRIRVAGIDAIGHQGPWSLWSEPWSDVYPGEPGQPQGFLIVPAVDGAGTSRHLRR